MTDVIDRVHGGTVEELAEFDRAPMPPNRPPLTIERRTGPIHVLLAVVLGCSAVLLMAMLGHLSGWRAALAVTVAWVDVALGVACIVRSRRWVTGLIMVGSLAGVGVWASAHDVPAVPRSVLWTGVGLAAASFLAALALSLAPALGRRWSPSTLVLLSVLPVAVAVVTTAALLAPPAVPVVHTASAAPRSFASASADLAIKTTVPVPGQNSSQFQRILAGNSSEQSEAKPFVPLGAADQAVLSQQLTQALFAAEKFPTVASAKAAGMILAGGMAPGVGAHYQVVGASDLTSLNGQFNPLEPASWIYASTADNAPVVGVMYESLTAQPPAGFVGPNDHWHRHANVCVKFDAGEIAVPFAADQNVTPQECSDVHGIFMKKTVWMVHAWVVPGWDSPQGVFSHDNLHVYCPGNTDRVDAIGFCTRQQ